MITSITAAQRLQIIKLHDGGKSCSVIAEKMGISPKAASHYVASKGRLTSIHSLSNRSKGRSTTKASPTAIPLKTADTIYTIDKFKPDPNGPHLNATMTGRYLGLELDYRR
ncbi:helix-turn-helix domain-containing protein [Comamonas sp. GB3 AK4-5]|uniref:helix-turn-helix domain-containing protein n=1 Tax=Comamonas sp. GB3 AK4-5 TaxID=3231487 RepID=UPI00351E97E0